MYIKSINIKNFRSISSQKIELSDITTFIGDNDAGKSNIFKSINLFFNNQTDFNTNFDFNNDFCKSAKVSSKMAKEIIIILEFIIPNSFKEKQNIFWKKVWRKEGILRSKETMTYENKKNVNQSRNRAIHWLQHIRFRYVPAIKSDYYFQELLGDLNDTLAESVEKKIHGAAKAFSKTIQESTDKITTELLNKLNMDSSLVLPTDLRKTFQTLDFNTKYSGTDISLTKRGDGIKTRHIPVILKFLAEQDDRTRTQGAPKVSTIWGFEEPENNIELSNAFLLAKDLYEYSFEIQILITTHSPAFYSLNRLNDILENYPKIDSNKITTYFVCKDKNDGMSTVIEKIDDFRWLDSKYGIIPLIAPYVIENIERLNTMKSEYSRLRQLINNYEKPVLLTEGKTDPIILTRAYNVLYPKEEIPFNILSCNTTPNLKDETGGASILKLALNAHRPDLPITIGLFDHDEAGVRELNNLNSYYIKTDLVYFHKNKKAAALSLPPIIGLEDYYNNENLCIEFLFPDCFLTKNINGKGLEFKYKKITERVGSKKISERDASDPYFREISNGKIFYAEKIVPILPDEAFVNFKYLFGEIMNVLKKLSMPSTTGRINF